MVSEVKEFAARDKTRIFYREWEGKKNGDIILYLHGLESHMGWFINTGNLLNQKGFHVYAVDRRGSGMSQAERGHMESYWTVLDDVKEVIELARRKHPGEKLYLAGLCWGGLVAATFACHHQDLIDGLILLSPAIRTKVDLPLKQKIDVAFSSIFRPRKLFDVPLADWMFTRNPKYLDFIKKDGVKLRKATARLFFETRKMNFCSDRIAHKLHIPVLVFLAGDDVIIDNEKVKKWFTTIGSKDKTIKVFGGCYHNLQFEKDVENLINYIADWIKRKKER